MENKLTVFNRGIIPVYTDMNGNKAVNGRELHTGLKIDTDHTKWFDRMCEYGFTHHTDFTEFWEDESESIFDIAHFKSPQQAAALGYQKNHLLTLEMSKHIAMIQRTPEGKAMAAIANIEEATVRIILQNVGRAPLREYILFAIYQEEALEAYDAGQTDLSGLGTYYFQRVDLGGWRTI